VRREIRTATGRAPGTRSEDAFPGHADSQVRPGEGELLAMTIQDTHAEPGAGPFGRTGAAVRPGRREDEA